MVRGGLEAARIVATIQIGSDGKAGLRFGGSSIVEDLLVGVQRFTDTGTHTGVRGLDSGGHVCTNVHILSL